MGSQRGAGMEVRIEGITKGPPMIVKVVVMDLTWSAYQQMSRQYMSEGISHSPRSRGVYRYGRKLQKNWNFSVECRTLFLVPNSSRPDYSTPLVAHRRSLSRPLAIAKYSSTENEPIAFVMGRRKIEIEPITVGITALLSPQSSHFPIQSSY